MNSSLSSYTANVQYLKLHLRKNVGATLCGRPQDGQPQRVAPTIKELFLADKLCCIFNFPLVAAQPRCVFL
jgi:hypothetical protein